MFIPGIAWFFIVGVLTLIPGNDVPEVGWLNIPHFDKLVHAGMFAVLTFLFSLPYIRSSFTVEAKKNMVLRISLVMITWGFFIEVIQKNFVPGRSFEWLDVMADAVGVLLALLFCNRLIRAAEPADSESA